MWTPAGRESLRLAAHRRVLWKLAGLYRKIVVRKTRIAAVVGSFGKTTTTRALCAALGLPGPAHDNWNAGVHLAATVLSIRPRSHCAVIEVGINGKGQMERCASLLRPSITVVTSIGSEHVRSFGTLEVTRAEKAKMVAALPATGYAILNGDDPNVLWMRDHTAASVVTYGLREANQVRASDVVEDEIGGVRFKLHVDGQAHEVRSRLIGRHMIYPLLAAVAASRVEGRNIGQVLAALARLDPTWNRLQPIQHRCGAVLLLDAFKGAVETIDAALDTVDQLSAERKIIILGEVEEPPGKQGPIYKQLGKRAGEIAERVVFVGGKKSFNSFRAGMTLGGLTHGELIHVRANPLDAAREVEADLRRGDIVLIKGRSTQHLERVALVLTGVAARCRTRLCRREHDCATCPLLRRNL